MHEGDFLRALQQRIADIAAGTSTLRGQLEGKGKIRVVQRFLGRQVNLSDFATSDALSFKRALDATTEELVAAVPSLKWGSARKALNIFLRDCLYDRYITERILLQQARAFMEVPLDSHSGKWLRREAEKVQFADLPPRWSTIVSVTPFQSEQFQRAAERLARRPEYNMVQLGLERVDLDVLIWRQQGAEL